MSIIYLCRHCNSVIGTLQQDQISLTALGLDSLTETERKKMIHYEENGDIHIRLICEGCEQTLSQHPNYYELDYFLQ